jgi:energy-converting hydrogenase Eha subunit F
MSVAAPQEAGAEYQTGTCVPCPGGIAESARYHLGITKVFSSSIILWIIVASYVF